MELSALRLLATRWTSAGILQTACASVYVLGVSIPDRNREGATMGDLPAGLRRGTAFSMTTALLMVLSGTTCSVLKAQAPEAQPSERQSQTAKDSAAQLPVPEWETAAGGKMEFDVASIKQDTTAPS